MTVSNLGVVIRDEPYQWVRPKVSGNRHLVPVSMTASSNPKSLCRQRVRNPQVDIRGAVSCIDCTHLMPLVDVVSVP